MSKIKNGTIAEMIVVSELLKEGHSVFLPISHDNRYDLIIDNKKKLIRIQVKKAFLHKEGKKMAYYIETRRRTDAKPVPYGNKDFDFCIACNITSNVCWVIPIDIFLLYKSGLKLESLKIEKYKKAWGLLK